MNAATLYDNCICMQYSVKLVNISLGKVLSSGYGAND